MERIGSRELKQRTGDVIARIQRGERIILTYRGRAIAVISPIDQDALNESLLREVEKSEASTLEWLKASESSFDFWDNPEDEVWNEVEVK